MTNTTFKSFIPTSTHINKVLYNLSYLTFFIVILLFMSINATAADYDNDPIETLLPFDAIPAITNPQFVPAEKAKINSYDPVIGVTFNDESHVYSLYLLNGHEIVNDVVGGEKIATTW